MQDFAGIGEKLKRANENLRNLQMEIFTFFDEGDYPVLPENNHELLLKAIEYHKQRPIPARFAVLTGEIMHHLRSSFDHIVWHFSVGATDKDKWIEFPIFEERPRKTKDIERFKKKIERIQDTRVVNLIKSLQPYNSPTPADDPLLIIHSLDIVDKHRELLLCVSTGSTVFPKEMEVTIKAYERAHPDLDPAQIARHFKDYGTPKPSVSFQKFGQRTPYSVPQGLTELFNYTVDVVQKFEAL